MIDIVCNHRPIVITGPSGWIGTALLAHLAQRRGAGWEKNVRLFGSNERTIIAPDGTLLRVQSLDAIDGATVVGADVVHLAHLTKEKVDVLGAARFLEGNLTIDSLLTAALRKGRAASLFVASSGAAHLAEIGRDRHLYGISKLLQEDHFLRIGLEESLPVFVGRIFNLAGPYINKMDSYAISSFIVQAITWRKIKINANVPVFRAYLHVLDLCAIIVGVLERKIAPERITDLCGDQTVEMDDIARSVAAEIDLPVSAIERPAVDHALPSTYVGQASDTKVLAMMCDHRLASFASQVTDTAMFVRLCLA